MSARVEQFEELVAWQKARALTARVYQITGENTFSRDFALRDQTRRAAVSVMSNVAEGFERTGAAEFHHFLTVAKASCAELRSQLYVALDVGYIEQETFDALLAQAAEVGRVLGGLRLALQRRRNQP